MKTPTTLIILDGYGLREETYGNAVRAANTPVLDGLFATCPHTELRSSGLEVGLPDGQIGNSEVGHMNIGAGRIVFQELPRINLAIKNGSFFQNAAILKAMEDCKRRGKALHLMGLLSDGGVHSSIEHLYAYLEMAKLQGIAEVYIHAFLDGRDVPPKSGAGYLSQCIDKCGEIGVGTIATVMGRYYAMDRDKRWDRLELAYNALVCGEGEFNRDPVEAVRNSYEKGVTDEFVEPIICANGAEITSGDSVIFINFRPDRARELTRALCDPDFNEFNRRFGYFPLTFVCATQYDETIPNALVAFKPHVLQNLLGEYLSRLGLTQLRIAETEKYAHVTFFFNGGAETLCAGEDRVLIPSPKVATYDLKPEMSAYEVANEAVKRIKSGKYDVVIINFANCDMVGHTGVFEAAVKAVETVDECVGLVTEATASMGGISIITADHGNAERMLADDGTPYTAHTLCPVPLIIYGIDAKLRDGGTLADIAPTMLDIMGLKQPPEMDGRTLIEN
jgi:2,3-bisphosphoglycerate-independent phosphoglycerate mutase